MTLTSFQRVQGEVIRHYQRLEEFPASMLLDSVFRGDKKFCDLFKEINSRTTWGTWGTAWAFLNSDPQSEDGFLFYPFDGKLEGLRMERMPPDESSM